MLELSDSLTIPAHQCNWFVQVEGADVLRTRHGGRERPSCKELCRVSSQKSAWSHRLSPCHAGGGGTGTGRVSLFMALLPDCHAMQVTSQCSLNFSWQTQLGPSPSPCQVQEISQIDEPSENAPTEGAQSPSMPAEPAKPTHPEVSHINICHTPPLPSV